MIRLKTFFSDKIVILVILFILIITVTISLGYKKSKDAVMVPVVTEIAGRAGSVKETGTATELVERKDPVVMSDDLSKVILNVSNMSCSGCISTIKSSVVGFQGIKEILVEISSGKVEIYFDSDIEEKNNYTTYGVVGLSNKIVDFCFNVEKLKAQIYDVYKRNQHILPRIKSVFPDKFLPQTRLFDVSCISEFDNL